MTGSASTLRINLWSGPRNLSTALMYSWRSRSDTTVVDEPLYAHYLTTVGDELKAGGREHPGDHAVLASQDANGARVVAEHLLGPWDSPVVLFKQMAKHLVGLDPESTTALMAGCANVILTRTPRDMLLSFQQQVPNASLADTGLAELVEIAETVVNGGQEPIVVDSALLLANPASVLGQLCHRVGLEFDSAMLSWPAGPKPEDGVWARHWYHSVHQSTSFSSPSRRDGALNPQLAAVLPEANELYDLLRQWRITPTNGETT